MCEWASLVVAKDRVYWSMKTNSHTAIHEEFSLHVDGARGPNVVNVEITPPDGNFTAPINQWNYRVDQDVLPPWYDVKDAEKRARAALVDYAKARIFCGGEHTVSGSASVRASGSASVTAYGSASVTASGSASVTAYDSASVTASDSASVTAYNRASVTAYNRASVTAYNSASVTAYNRASVTAYNSASVRASGSACI